MDRLMVGVSGVRGTVGESLTPHVACDFACAFATMLGPGGSVTLARDSRSSGPMLRDAVQAGLLASGLNVIDLGLASTPGAALMTARLPAVGGVIITASHNPPEYNGLKFLRPTGTPLAADDARKLEALWRAGEFALADHAGQGTASSNADAPARYVEAVCQTCDVEAIARRKFQVVLDSINGAGCVASRILLDRLACKLVHLNGQPDGQFAHSPEPVEENLTQLAEAVRSHGADVGFAQDADADRLAIVDETGRFIGEEYTLALAAAFTLRHRKGPLATNLSTSRMVDDLAAAAGCQVVRAPTGEANVVDAMARADCILGGEGGGGVIDPRVVGVRNSLTGIVMVLQYLAETGKTVSELVARIPQYVMIKTKLPCPAGAAEAVVARARQAFAERDGVHLNDADGLRVDFSDRWVSVRASNTEPILRIIAEAPGREDAEALVAEMQHIADEAVAGS